MIPPSESASQRLLLGIAIAAAGLIPLSIAGSQIALGLGVLLLIIVRRRLDFPRIWVPLLAFFTWTILADSLSPDPWLGRAQIKKFYVFLLIPLLYGVLRNRFANVFYLVAIWTAVGTASALWGLVQFLHRYREIKSLGQDFYSVYVGRRITGFESHWMTFGALELAILSIVLAYWFFSDKRQPAFICAGASLLISAAIMLGWTRSIWIAAAPAVLYLVWNWRPKMTWAVPVIAVAAFLVAPRATRERLTSLVSPHGETDSNLHRIVTFRTGLEMVKAHPWFGIGPEEISRNFDKYAPADIRRPFPVGYYGHLHNIYIQYAAERGIPALVCILWFIGLATYDALRAIRRLKHARSQELAVLHGAVAVVIGILVGGLAEHNLGDSEVLMMFVSVIALSYAAIANVANTESKGDLPVL